MRRNTPRASRTMVAMATSRRPAPLLPAAGPTGPGFTVDGEAVDKDATLC